MNTIFITGASGYVGAMIVNLLSKRSDVKKIVALDKDPAPSFLKNNPKVLFIQANTSDNTWQSKVALEKPNIVIHSAWQIREIYGNKKLQWKWNVEGSKSIFDFCFKNPFVEEMIYFSSAAVYGAFSSNSFEHYFKEDEPLRAEEYLYGIEKRVVEEELLKMMDNSNGRVKVFVVRPAAITGPRGRGMHHRFGLQSSLSGHLEGSFFYSLIKALVFRMPATKGWVRQFVHEDDVCNIVEKLAFSPPQSSYEVFNLAPSGAPVFPKDMAEVVEKKILWVYPAMIRFVFFLAWHLSFGVIPTSKGSWKYYSYPVLMDGSKVTRLLSYEYSMESKEAFRTKKGSFGEH